MYQKVGEHRRHGFDPDTMGDNLPRVDLGTGQTASQVEACHSVLVRESGPKAEGPLLAGPIIARASGAGQKHQYSAGYGRLASTS